MSKPRIIKVGATPRWTGGTLAGIANAVRVLRLCAVGVLCLGAWGCQSLNTPVSASFASVKIGGIPLEAIRKETARVFAGEGYQVAQAADAFVFEREGTRRDQLAYGGGIDEAAVRIRVKAQIVTLGGELYRLQCTAYAVRGAGSVMEDEIQLPPWRRGSFQDLLDQVSRNLKGVTIIRPT